MNQWAFKHSVLCSKRTNFLDGSGARGRVHGAMPEFLVAQTLTAKRAEILGRIRAYEARIAQAKHDLAHVNATIEMFAAPEGRRARYMVSHGFFRKGEITDIRVLHLGVDGEMTTRELAERVMAERALDISDAALRNSVVFKVARRRAMPGAANSRAWWKSARACASGPRETRSRRASLPAALPRPADRRRQGSTDQSVRQATVAFLPMILEPGGMSRVSVEIPALDPQALAADHASQPREVALGEIGMRPVGSCPLRRCSSRRASRSLAGRAGQSRCAAGRPTVRSSQGGASVSSER
jgi:hypothetical protein